LFHPQCTELSFGAQSTAVPWPSSFRAWVGRSAKRAQKRMAGKLRNPLHLSNAFPATALYENDSDARGRSPMIASEPSPARRGSRGSLPRLRSRGGVTSRGAPGWLTRYRSPYPPPRRINHSLNSRSHSKQVNVCCSQSKARCPAGARCVREVGLPQLRQRGLSFTPNPRRFNS
jgi:hypothetical protein